MGLGLFWHLTFRQETFWQEHFNMGIFWHHGRFSALEHFSTRIFWHMDILAHLHFDTMQSNIDILAQTFRTLCQNVHVPKYPCAQMSQCCNVPVPKCSWCGKIPMLKCSHTEMSLCQKVPVMKCPYRNVRCRNKLEPIRKGQMRGAAENPPLPRIPINKFVWKAKPKQTSIN